MPSYTVPLLAALGTASAALLWPHMLRSTRIASLVIAAGVAMMITPVTNRWAVSVVMLGQVLMMLGAIVEWQRRRRPPARPQSD